MGSKARFEDAPGEWARVQWIRPAPGYIDPTKEMQAYKLAVDSKFMSRTQVIAEGGGNRDDVFQQIAEEEQLLEELGIAPVPETKDAGAAPDATDDKVEKKAEDVPEPAEARS